MSDLHPPVQSKDELDRQFFAPRYNPWQRPISSVATQVMAKQEVRAHQQNLIGLTDSTLRMKLDGTWQLAEEGSDEERLHGEWQDAIPAQVPGSIHTALVDAGKLDDPSFGTNARLAKAYSHRTWWHKCTFTLEQTETWNRGKLIFDGISPSCEVWLNGHKLGMHEGSFGGPEYDIGEQLQPHNTLIVKVHPAPLGNEWNVWHSAVVFNCNYGWHYVDLPAVGIWQSVRLEAVPQQYVQHPFVAVHTAEDAHAGRVELTFELADQPVAGDRVYGWIEREPDTTARWSKEQRTSFDTVDEITAKGDMNSQALFFEWNFEPNETESERNSETDYHVRIELNIPDPQLWWPLDMGEQALYRLKLVGKREEGGTQHHVETTFGIRHIEMKPFADGISEDQYNWTFVVNGVPVFAKGTGWCTLDALMDFKRERYAHFLGLAADQHVNFMRAWGGGIPETDDFYDWCDRLGIMIMQEWPTCWGSHANQPREALEETVRRNTLRLRNRPSLVMWCGGNETSSELDHETMRMMGRLAIELDDTRPFHRTDPLGGSTHDHIVWNGWTPAYSFDYYAGLNDRLLSEFGLASAPVVPSMQRYMPEAEQQPWPPAVGESFYAHLPAFDTRDEMRILSEFAGSFVTCDSMESFTIGTQLAQIVSLRHKMERARCHWPQQTGVVTYKLNDVYPGVSWSTIDWYGVPKPSHYFTANAYAPLAVYVVFEKLNSPEQAQALPVYVVDERGGLQDRAWTASVRLYDENLKEMMLKQWKDNGDESERHFDAEASLRCFIRELGSIELKGYSLEQSPVLVVSELHCEGELVYRTFYWINFDARPGVLFRLPATELEWSPVEQMDSIERTDLLSQAPLQTNISQDAASIDARYPYQVRIRNCGSYPAVATELYQNSSTPQNYALAKQQFFWLDAGEERIVDVRLLENIQLRAWNAAHSPLKTRSPATLSSSSEQTLTATSSPNSHHQLKED